MNQAETPYPGDELIVRDADGNRPLPEPHEDAEAFCKRLFGGKEFPCRRCQTETIYWLGVCDKCDDALKREAEADSRPRTIHEILAHAGVPPRYLGWVWKGCPLPNGMHLGRLRAWGGEPPTMTLYGPPGTGKTGAAICFLRDWALNHNRVKWLYVPDWLNNMRFLEREGDSRHELGEVKGFNGLLVLDELVTKRLTEYGLETMLIVIDARVRCGYPTILTSNLPVTGPNGISSIDGRIASRLECGRVIEWTGADRRRGEE